MTRGGEHPEREVAAGGADPAPAKLAEVHPVAASDVEYATIEAVSEPGQSEHPSRDVERRLLVLPQALPGPEIRIVGVLRGWIQRHWVILARNRCWSRTEVRGSLICCAAAVAAIFVPRVNRGMAPTTSAINRSCAVS